MTLAPSWVEVPFQVDGPEDGRRVDAYLAGCLQRYSRAEVQKLIGAGRVFLRGRLAKPASRVAAGETVLIRYPRRAEPPCGHARLEVLHEDDELLAVNKPGDILCHPTHKPYENTVTTVLARPYPGRKLHLRNRRGRETSGVLLLAMSPAGARSLWRQFMTRGIKKEYLALVAGRVSWKERTLDLPLGREGGEIHVRQAGAEDGQPALTEFQLVEAGPAFSLVRAMPATGRLHQIRVHLAHLGHPVLGDKLYTGDGSCYLKAVRRELSSDDLEGLGAPRQLLHAHRISLKHPASGGPLRIEAPLPSDFAEVLSRLRG
jgi:23S rRNA pseudouridine1911/1915/1917 synthase